MEPLSLTLEGFCGVRDGLGRAVITLDIERLADGAELIAIAGANGRGKSTLMDNLHPYLTMPSRAAAAGPGGFTYYDQVYLPESTKQLIWTHDGRSYRTQVVIRVNGRRRIEAYLCILAECGNWKPVRLDDGTVSDGKAQTYTRCVEAICGSAETFFTSVFSAQGKRQLSAYQNAEIKTLLADLLGQESIRALGQQANEAARLIKAGLSAMRQEQGGLHEEAQRIETGLGRLAGAEDRVQQGLAARQAAQVALETASQRHAKLVADREQSHSVEPRRRALQDEYDGLAQADAQASQTVEAQDRTEQERLERLQQRISQRVNLARSRSEGLQSRRRRCLAVLVDAPAVQRAERRLSLAERVMAQRVARLDTSREQVQRLVQCRNGLRVVEQRLVGIECEAGQAALTAEDLLRRFGLTGEVPCAGSALQHRCKLLGDAREARTLVPDARGVIRRLADQKVKARQEIAALQARCADLAGAPAAQARAERRLQHIRALSSRLALRVAKAGEIAQARNALADIDQELAALPAIAARVGPIMETEEEQAERQHIEATRQALAARHSEQVQRYRVRRERLTQALAALPAAYDAQQLTDAKRAMAQAAKEVEAAEQRHLMAVRDAQTWVLLTEQAETVAARRSTLADRVARIEIELGNWMLFGRCMSNDGLIALAIDDAGPALSGLANDLLLACYGPRFTVSILTLVETGKGEREGFDIVVHDGESGQSKSVGLMSGGERVWINECLVRAVALYLATHTGRRYGALFSDELDGPLDSEHKRMMMSMKRAVLRLGGYRKEFFVSQTPELTAMADAVIDLDAWREAATCGRTTEVEV